LGFLIIGDRTKGIEDLELRVKGSRFRVLARQQQRCQCHCQHDAGMMRIRPIPCSVYVAAAAPPRRSRLLALSLATCDAGAGPSSSSSQLAVVLLGTVRQPPCCVAEQHVYRLWDVWSAVARTAAAREHTHCAPRDESRGFRLLPHRQSSPQGLELCTCLLPRPSLRFLYGYGCTEKLYVYE
jgi:hypothetical protein